MYVPLNSYYQLYFCIRISGSLWTADSISYKAVEAEFLYEWNEIRMRGFRSDLPASKRVKTAAETQESEFCYRFNDGENCIESRCYRMHECIGCNQSSCNLSECEENPERLSIREFRANRR
jgi:hypothetical protein